jgi:erythritol kinase (D-erythritol 1-phosphate-forming)
MVVVCVDAGTTVVKAVAFDDQGAEVALARRATAVLRPRLGWTEQEMTAVWDAVVATVREVVARVGPARVGLLAFTGQGDGCWLVDAHGQPTGTAMLWSDGRAAAIVERWSAEGVLEQAFRLNGSLTFAGLPNAILAWLATHDPDRLKRSATLLTCDGWLFLKLTGQLASDESDASNPLLDIRARRWSPELLRLYGLDWAERLLPEVRGDDRRIAELTGWAAEELGLASGIPVVMAPYDICATAIGAGAVAAGQACSILGTTLCTEVVLDEVDTGGEPSAMTVALGVPGRWLRAFPTLAGTEVLTWVLGLLGLSRPDELAALAAQAEPGAGDLAFLPYLSPSGERAPFLDPGARGMLLGLRFGHGRQEIARAVFEGLTLVIRDCFEAARTATTELRLCGGGAGSDLWCQLIADVTRVPTSRSADREVGAQGALICALVATGAAPSFDAVRAMCVDAAGTVRASSSAPLPAPERPAPGWVEQDASTWWPAAATALRHVTTALGRDRVRIAAVSVAATSGTVVMVDAAGEPLGPALLYSDRRAWQEAERADALGRGRWDAYGLRMAPSFGLPKLAWLLRHSEARAHARHAWHASDFVVGRLVGFPPPTDWSHALKSGYDVLRGEWPAEVLDALDIPVALLPPVRPPTTAVTTVAPGTGTGLPAGCEVRLGMTDGCSGQVAAGAVTPGRFVSVLGTTLVVKGVGEELLRYPLLQAGERFPFFAPDATGFAIGEPADEIERYRATLEGVAFVERLAYDTLRGLGMRMEGPVATAGGGGRSQVWAAIRASVLGRPLSATDHAETAFGACMLAAAGTLHAGLAEAASAMVRTRYEVHPDPAEQSTLLANYERFVHALADRGWIPVST